MSDPQIIQAGMGVGISGWQLANAVAGLGELGVVSGTALDAVCVRRLQLGDPGGHVRRALGKFPVPEMADKILNRYFLPEGSLGEGSFASAPMASAKLTRDHQELLIVANFVEVYLAKENHGNSVGINYLEKIQMPLLPSLFGAMLADVDYVLMGAGIPREVPGVLDKMAICEDVEYSLHVDGATSEDHFKIAFSPRQIMGNKIASLKRPKFLAIISSSTLALTLARKASGKVDGFVVEAPSAGGHNASPRGKLQLNQRGEPVYGPRDEVDLVAMRELELPFWLAGSRSHEDSLAQARALGAAGIQVGTSFALCEESGLSPALRLRILESISNDRIDIFTDPLASPTGFPFKVVSLQDTNSELETYETRNRVCDLGYLRTPYKKEDGSLGFRCPAEPIDLYIKKGGQEHATVGRKCLCNALMSNIELGQNRSQGHHELPLVTLGDDLTQVKLYFKNGSFNYTAADVVNSLRESSIL